MLASKARVVSCLSMVVSCHVKQNWLHKGRYGEWFTLHQVLPGNVTHIHAWNHY